MLTLFWGNWCQGAKSVISTLSCEYVMGKFRDFTGKQLAVAQVRWDFNLFCIFTFYTSWKDGNVFKTRKLVHSSFTFSGDKKQIHQAKPSFSWILFPSIPWVTDCRQLMFCTWFSLHRWKFPLCPLVLDLN